MWITWDLPLIVNDSEGLGTNWQCRPIGLVHGIEAVLSGYVAWGGAGPGWVAVSELLRKPGI